MALSLVGLTAVAVVPPALASTGGSSPSGAGAASLEQEVVVTARQLGVLSTDMVATQARLQSADAALDADDATLANVRTQLLAAKARLRSIALDDYMGSGNANFSGISWSSPTRAAASAAYQQIASDREATSADAFLHSEIAVTHEIQRIRTTRATIAQEYATLAQRQRALQSTVDDERSMLAVLRQQESRVTPVASGTQGLPVRVVPIAHSAPDAVTATATVTASSAPTTAGTTPTNPTPPSGTLSQDLAKLRQCESGDNYGANTGNGYYGAYQFSLATWEGLGYSGLPSAAPPATQDAAAIKLEEASGWGQWPVCAAELGLG
jgi:hypothetical protein